MPQSEFWPFESIKSIKEVDVNGEPSILQKQLGDMEGEVKVIQMELAAIKKDRRDLVSRKQPKGYALVPELGDIEDFRDHSDCDVVPRYTEIYKLREELIRAKNAAEDERIQREKYEEKLKELESKLNDICSGDIVAEMKDKRYSNEEIASLKIQNRDLREEMEELNITLNEKNEQLQEYRMRYLQAQQQVEEAKRQRDLIEFDSKQVSDQIQLEIQKMKMQFQEKLQELAPLPELLKGAQIQLQEAKQLQKLAEDSSQQLSGELHRVNEKLAMAVSSFNQEKAEKQKIVEKNKIIKISLYEKDKEIDAISKDLDDYKKFNRAFGLNGKKDFIDKMDIIKRISNKVKVCRLEEKLVQLESRFKDKAIECSQLLKDLDELRGESSRSLTRCKDRSESMRRYLQTQISELERQLIQSRAQCSACQKERDDIRQRLQMQINSLRENFELVEIRLRALQNQVGSLKNTYSVILADEDDEFNKMVGS